MAVILFGEFVLLFQMACVVFLFAYLFSKSRFYIPVLEHRASVALQVFLAIVFGPLSVYGMSSGITFYTANVNIRDFGPLAAGLACGPYVGLGAGIIGFLYRLSVGGTNVYAVAIGPLTAGIVGGLVYYYSNRELISTKYAVIITAVVESFVSAIAIVARILDGDSVEKVITVIVNVALPMTVMTSIAIGVFCIILHNQIRDLRTQKEKMQLELEVESRKNLETVINTIGDPVFVKDRSHRWILVNDGFCQMIGRSREEVIGKTSYDFSRTKHPGVFSKMTMRCSAPEHPMNRKQPLKMPAGRYTRPRSRKPITRIPPARNSLSGSYAISPNANAPKLPFRT